MISAWYKHISDPDEQERFKKNVLNSKTVLNRLMILLDQMDQDLTNSELSAKNYDSPNWAPKQAHVNGQKAQIRTIKFLINLDQEE